MIAIEYLLGTNKTVLLNLTKAFSEAFGQNIYAQNNKVFFPRTVASGQISFYELEDGMTLMLIDAVFTKELQFINEAENNGFSAIWFFVGKGHVQLQLNDSRKIAIENSWEDSVFFSASAASAAITVPADMNFKVAVLLVHRRWLSQLLKGRDWLLDIVTEKTISPIQFMQSLNVEMLLTIEDVFKQSDRRYTANAYLQGCVRKLLAQLYTVAVNPLPQNKHTEKPLFEDVLTAIQIKHDIEKDMVLAQLNVDLIADKYKINRAKLNTLFKMVYGDYFTSIAHKVRMQAAVELLLQGYSVLEIGRKVGYGNTSHFARTFYNTFKITPKKYQMAARPSKEKLNKQNIEIEINS